MAAELAQVYIYIVMPWVVLAWDTDDDESSDDFVIRYRRSRRYAMILRRLYLGDGYWVSMYFEAWDA
jgi:hypothetical protein